MTNSSRRDVLAPAGPAWAGSLMGTCIFATLAHIHDVPVVPELLLFVAAGILGFIVVGWLRFRNPPFHSKLQAPWGMFAMGIMSLGSSASSVFNDSAWQRATWWIGAPLAIYVSLRQLRGFEGEPTFQWGLALVAPMVAATSGAQWLYAVSAGLLCLLAVHWCVCVARFGWWARELAVRI